MHAQLDDLLTTSSPSAEAPAGRRGSRTPSSSRWRSPKSSWDCRTTASFWRSPATGSRTCSPTCHVSRATTSVCARSPHRSSERSTTSPSARRGGAISCGCSIRPRSPARPRARRFGAPSSRGSQPTATAALTRATSGAFASICSARATGPRSPSSSPRQMLRARGRARDARAGPARRPHRHRRQGLRRRRVRGLDGRSRSRVSSSRSQGRAAPIRIARARAPVDRIGLFGPARDSSASSATAPAHSRACAPRRAAAPRPRCRPPA